MPPTHEVENVIPVFPVRDLDRSVAFYTTVLDFRLAWRAETVCAVARDGHSLMLSTADGIAAPAMAWIGVETEQLFARCLDADVPVVQPPRNQEFAYTMRVADPDGNILWLGTSPRAATD